MPASTLGQLNMQRLSGAFKARGVTVQFFSDPAEAFKWLAAAK
jgi:hypothetical protein